MSLTQNELYEFGPFTLDPADRTVLRDGTPLAVTPKVFDTLVYLIRNRGRLLSKDELLKGIWPDAFVEEVNLAVNISTLRKLFGEGPQDGRYIVTVPGSGYRFVAEVNVLARKEGPIKSGEETLANLSSVESPNQLDQTQTIADPRSPSSEQTGRTHSKNIWIGATIAVIALAAIIVLYNFRRAPHSPGLTPQDSILLADFQNSTGEPVLFWKSARRMESCGVSPGEWGARRKLYRTMIAARAITAIVAPIQIFLECVLPVCSEDGERGSAIV